MRHGQIERINATKKSRDSKKCEDALKKLTDAAKSGKGNLLELAVEAAK